MTPNLVLWEASVRRLPLPQQLEVAHRGGFDGLGLTPSALLSSERELGSLDAVRDEFRRAGVSLHLDTLTSWAPIRYPRNADDFLVRRFDHSIEACLRLVEALDVASVLAVGAFDIGSVPFEDLVSGFGSACDVFAGAGVAVNLEFMPFWGVPDLSSAVRIVRAAGRANSGIMIDTWHYAHSGSRMSDLGPLDSAVPVHMQLADGYPAPAGADLVFETMHRRVLPGRGSLPVAQVCRAVLGRNVPFSAGPEVFSDELDLLDAAELVPLLRNATAAALGL